MINERWIRWKKVYNKEINKIALSSNNDQRMQSIDSIEHMYMEREKTEYVKKKRLNVITWWNDAKID